MTKTLLTLTALLAALLTTAQRKNSPKWEKVTSEMTKANQGDTISVRSKKILEWPDFKMTPQEGRKERAHIELTFGVFTKKVNVWTGTITVEGYGGLRKDLSWASPKEQSEQLKLSHRAGRTDNCL